MLLFSVQIFPENSQQFTAYGTVAMGGECGYEISAIIIDAINPELSQVKKSVICITAGVAISSLTQYLLRDHYEPEEESWCLTGRGHWIVFRVGVDTIKGLTRKKERKATLEKWKEETIEFN
jgi:hypothetical protein